MARQPLDLFLSHCRNINPFGAAFSCSGRVACCREAFRAGCSKGSFEELKQLKSFTKSLKLTRCTRSLLPHAYVSSKYTAERPPRRGKGQQSFLGETFPTCQAACRLCSAFRLSSSHKLSPMLAWAAGRMLLSLSHFCSWRWPQQNSLFTKL